MKDEIQKGWLGTDVSVQTRSSMPSPEWPVRCAASITIFLPFPEKAEQTQVPDLSHRPERKQLH